MSEWISIDEKLPKIGETVLFYRTFPKETRFNLRAEPLKRCNIGMGGLRSDFKWIWYPFTISEHEVTFVSHWMTLPEVPKEDI